jgi:hypothetical protein
MNRSVDRRMILPPNPPRFDTAAEQLLSADKAKR